MRQLQAASAVGQAQLQQAWERAFSRVGLQAAQILLSPADVADRQTYVNVRNTFDALFRLGAVPVVNENDATATDEITFGDNDALAAQVAVLTHARLLVLLTEVDGVYSRAPETPGAELLGDGSLTSAVRLGRGTGLGRGGMGSKIAAAELAAGAGIPTVIASGQADTASGLVEPWCSTLVPNARCVVPGRVSLPSVSRPATAASALEMRSSSYRRAASRSARESPRSPQPRSALGNEGSRSSTATGSSSTRFPRWASPTGKR